jgi:hypothetical protein
MEQKWNKTALQRVIEPGFRGTACPVFDARSKHNAASLDKV